MHTTHSLIQQLYKLQPSHVLSQTLAHTHSLTHSSHQRLQEVKVMKEREVALLREKLEISPSAGYGIRIGAGTRGPLGGTMGL